MPLLSSPGPSLVLARAALLFKGQLNGTNRNSIDRNGDARNRDMG